MAGPLPRKSLLLINYDQQWTSVRYAQVCEGRFPGVTILNLSLMTYKWWAHKRALYPGIAWPGTHYVPENSVAWSEGGFTFKEFMDANRKKFPGGIYIGGKLNYPNEAWDQTYTTLPYGFLGRLDLKPKNPEMPPEGPDSPQAAQIQARATAKEQQRFRKWAVETSDAWSRTKTNA